MQTRLVRERSSGLNSTGLRTWGMVFLVLATAGKALLQNRLLNMNATTDLLTALSTKEGMIVATIAVILQAVESCAAPIFCFLAVEGACKTADFEKYLLRVLGLALVTEIPYNFALTGKLLDLSSRNPVFAVALGLVMIWFFRRYSEKGARNTAIKVVVVAAAVVWGQMLAISHGACCALLIAVIWFFRDRPTWRTVAGITAAVSCSILSPFYLSAPMGFLFIHMYNGEKGPSGKTFNYLVYPACLLAIGVIGIFLM